MKNKLRISTTILITCLFIMLSSMTVFAVTPSDAKDSVVVVATYDSNGQAIGWGSGFAIGEPGKAIQYIVTNCHVVEPRDSDGNVIQSTVKVYFSAAANKFMSAEVYWKNQQKDLAVLKLPEPTKERKAMVFCPMKKINMDDSFAALGYPAASMTADFVKFDKSDISITKGGISKQVRINETNCYLLDLQISEGNSGGPVVNSDGEVVGINTFYILDKSQNPNGADVKASYAVAIDELMKNIDRSTIPYTVKGEITQMMLIYMGIGAAVIIAILAVVVLFIRKKKSRGTNDIPNPAISKGAQLNNATAQATPVVSTAPVITNAIVGVSGPLLNKKYNINKKVIMGRDPSRCEVSFPLDTPGVSGVHCELTIGNDGIFLKDLNSTYGTYLADGTKLSANIPVKISLGDKFYLGGEDNKFEVR